MRGQKALSRRAGSNPQPVNEADGKVYTAPAPYGGWNANGNLSNMPATDAVVMDNVFPGIVDVALRPGCLDWSTDYPDPVKALMVYEGPTGAKLFASSATHVYDATVNGSVGAAVLSCASHKWSAVNFSNAGGTYLVMVNGQDDMQVYNGTTWQAINAVSVPALTGVATSSLSQAQFHKKRLWFVEKNSMNLWYLPVEAFAGAATKFPCGALFHRGGKLAAISTWSLDSGNGQDDYFVILTTAGELAVYQGTDPTSSATWALVGVYYVGKPVGSKPLTQYGGDLILSSINGFYPLSRFLQSTIIERTSALDIKIQGAFLDFIDAYKANYGWEATVFHPGNCLIVNVPVAADTVSYQCVMNMTTKAWCRFTNWNATAFAVMGDELYYAGGRSVTKAWIGTSDKGQPIVGEVVQAYSYFKFGGQKKVSLVRPHISISDRASIHYGMDTDFKAYGSYSQVAYSLSPGTAIWDQGIWDMSTWAADPSALVPSWLTVPTNLGYLHAFRLQITSSSSTVAWTATNFLYRPAGIL